MSHTGITSNKKESLITVRFSVFFVYTLCGGEVFIIKVIVIIGNGKRKCNFCDGQDHNYLLHQLYIFSKLCLIVTIGDSSSSNFEIDKYVEKISDKDIRSVSAE